MTESPLIKPWKIDPDKLLLRPLTEEDASERYASWLNDPETNQYLECRHDTPFTKLDTANFINRCIQIQRHHWGIIYENQHVGNISCSLYNHKYKWVDISILLGEEKFRRMGLTTLSLAGAVEYLFTVPKFHMITAGCYASNTPSIDLFTQVGFKKDGILRDLVIFEGQYMGMVKFSLLEHEWFSRGEKIPRIRVLPTPWDL